MYQPYDLQKFLDTVAGLDYPKMLQAAEREVRAVEGRLAPGRVKGEIDKQYRILALDYLRLIKGFIFFLRRGMKPESLSEQEFRRFKPAVRSLVRKGQLKANILDLFR